MRLAAWAALALAVGACGTPPDLVRGGSGGGEVVYPTVSFSQRVQPVFASRCYPCHVARADGGLDLSLGKSYAHLVNVPSKCDPSMPLVTPGDSRRSLLISSMTSSPYDCVRAMPLGGNGLLSEHPFDYETVRLWVEQGAPNN